MEIIPGNHPIRHVSQADLQRHNYEVGELLIKTELCDADDDLDKSVLKQTNTLLHPQSSTTNLNKFVSERHNDKVGEIMIKTELCEEGSPSATNEAKDMNNSAIQSSLVHSQNMHSYEVGEFTITEFADQDHKITKSVCAPTSSTLQPENFSTLQAATDVNSFIIKTEPHTERNTFEGNNIIPNATCANIYSIPVTNFLPYSQSCTPAPNKNTQVPQNNAFNVSKFEMKTKINEPKAAIANRGPTNISTSCYQYVNNIQYRGCCKEKRQSRSYKVRRPVGRPRVYETNEEVQAARLRLQRTRRNQITLPLIKELHDHNYHNSKEWKKLGNTENEPPKCQIDGDTVAISDSSGFRVKNVAEINESSLNETNDDIPSSLQIEKCDTEPSSDETENVQIKIEPTIPQFPYTEMTHIKVEQITDKGNSSNSEAKVK